MVKHTKGWKTKSAGRFGVRYGRNIRKKVANIEEKTHHKHKCIQCGFPSVRRVGTGIWRCAKCGHTFAGGTYIPHTSVGTTVTRSVKRAIEQRERDAMLAEA
ncbi:MAG: 50S ribosomal protein L37ae [Euryarchaeota archaeon]|nr:50S ribosomal protein L37ae [Euryarchaeota archaeon]